jgi:hypothetical protein
MAACSVIVGYSIHVFLQELFFQYPWNNFLHAEVEHCINTILCNSPMEKETEHFLLTSVSNFREEKLEM